MELSNLGRLVRFCKIAKQLKRLMKLKRLIEKAKFAANFLIQRQKTLNEK